MSKLKLINFTTESNNCLDKMLINKKYCLKPKTENLLVCQVYIVFTNEILCLGMIKILLSLALTLIQIKRQHIAR